MINGRASGFFHTGRLLPGESAKAGVASGRARQYIREMNGHAWTLYDTEFIRLTYGVLPARRIANHLGRSIGAIYAAARTAGLVKRRKAQRRWTTYEREFVRLVYPEVRTGLVAAHLGRQPNQVYQHAYKQGLEKSERFRASPASGRTTGRQGIGTRFQKGLVPWNKGRKGYDAGGRSAETRFKPGARPQTWVPVGTVRRDPDGYLKRKVRDDAPPGMARRNWKYLHVLHWERYRGPVPPRHKIRFRNGDKTDIRMTNLELVSNAEHGRRNCAKRWRYPEYINQLRAAKARLTREINKRERQRNGRSEEQV